MSLKNLVNNVVKTVQSGDRIYMHSVASFPQMLMNALADRARQEPDLTNLKFIHLHIEGQLPFEEDEQLRKQGESVHLFVGHGSRKYVNQGVGSYLPCFLSDIPRLFQTRTAPIDWAFLNVSPPDRHGYCSLGPEVCAALSAAQVARKGVIALINPAVPRCLGNSFIHMSQITHPVDLQQESLPLACVEHHEQKSSDYVHQTGESSKDVQSVQQRIGSILSTLIPDRACLQVGIGSVPDAVLQALSGHQDLGLHSEMISDGVMQLMQKGVITNRFKSVQPGKSVTSFMLGSQSLYDFAHDNPAIHMDSAAMTNNPRIIAQNDRVVAINSAIEVDITGQVCADSIGKKFISGVGGQLDFERGAALSNGGMPVICLPSLKITKQGPASSIVSTLPGGSGVTTTRYHSHWIVTENGAVNLWGLTMPERARKLIFIAHQSAQEELAAAAYERYKILIN
ncbi:hypothetical protein MP228_005669 [Amoeboaphelidium protococcarum]|nr:hypothetical protein MP228_005669 [Amoeboaphelidium protococcarum]